MNLSDILKELENEENRTQTRNKNNIRLILYKYLSRWKWFAASVSLAMAAALAFAYKATPLYEINTTLLLRDKEKGADFSSNAVVNNLNGFSFSSSVENEAEVFKAQSLMVKTCQELNILGTFHIPKGPFRWREIYGTQVPVTIAAFEKNPAADRDTRPDITIRLSQNGFTIDGTQRTFPFGEPVTVPYGTFTLNKNTAFRQDVTADPIDEIKIVLADPIDYGKGMAESIKVSIVNKLASVIQISILDGHPKKGTDILNKLIEVYNKETENDKNRNALNTIAFIDEQLIGLTAELSAIEKEAENFKAANKITDISSEAQLFLSNTTPNRQQISELSVQISVLESIENYINQDPSSSTIVPSTLSINDITLTELINSFNNLQRERERMLRTTQPGNPIVVNLNQQIASLRTNILENIRNIKNGLLISRNSLAESSGQFQSRASKVPAIERELLDITRKQQIKQEHFILLTKKREEAALTLAATSTSNSKTIDPPSPSDFPVKPKKIIIYGAGLIIGLLIPFGFIYARDIIQEKIEFRTDIEQLTSARILGEISRNKATEGIIAISENRKNLISEQFRFIRSNLLAATNRKNNQVIMVSSGISGEGKTFFSVNLALSLGLIGKSVAVLELDLRRPAMLKALGINAQKGIAEYLAGEIKKTENIANKIQNSPNVTFFGSGQTPSNPAELMAGEKLHALIEELKKSHDYVIIDTAPVGLVSDAFAFEDIADITIFMLRYNHSTKAQAKTIEDIRKNKKFKNTLIVINDAKLELTYGYGASYAKDYYHA